MKFSRWLVSLSGFAVAFAIPVWFVFAAIVASNLFRLFPTLLVMTSENSGDLTSAGGWAFLAILFAPPLIVILLRARARSRMRGLGELEEEQPILVLNDEPVSAQVSPPRIGRLGYLFWRSGCGTLVATIIWLLFAPFLLVFLGIIVAIGDESAYPFSFSSPYVWAGIALIALPIVLLVSRWLRERVRVAAEMRAFAPATNVHREVTSGERVVTRIWGGLFMAGALWMVYLGAHLMAREVRPAWKAAKQSAEWPTTAGTIVTSTIVHGTPGGGGTDVQPFVRYEYTAPNGQPYVGHLIRMPLGDTTRTASSSTTRNYGDVVRSAMSEAERYPVGRKVRVAYNPDDPSIAVLEPGVSFFSKASQVAIVVVAAGMAAFIFWAGWKVFTSAR